MHSVLLGVGRTGLVSRGWTREGRATRGRGEDISEEAGEKQKRQGEQENTWGAGGQPSEPAPERPQGEELRAGTEVPTHVGLTQRVHPTSTCT